MARCGSFRRFALDAADIMEAWHNVLKAMGIDPETMDKVNDSLTHYAIDWMKNFMPEPDPGGVKPTQDALEEYLDIH